MLLLWQHYGYLSSSHVNDYVCEGSLTQVTYRYNILQECQILDTIFDSVVENLKKKMRSEYQPGQGASPTPAYVFIYGPVTDLALYVLIT